ncbi:MAG TPA: 50S ribosomal protein L15 [bacterium]|nr:50S ribosomal protein L15 [bacterium]
MFTLNTLKPAKGSKKKKRDLGRGGKRGTFSGRGSKGQKARSGGKHKLNRLGMRRLMQETPKLRGFKSRQIKPEILNLETLAKKFKANDKISPEVLLENKLLKNIKNGVKILGRGEIDFKLEISNCEVSANAKEKIEKAGGVII